jgi:carboxypeptidase Taq
MERGTAPFRVERKGYHVTWEALPAWVCTYCGDVYFEETGIETIQFDFELQLLEGTLEVRDLPEAWRARFKADFGITPPDDRDGVLQDAHWFDGVIGGQFQCYTLGNIMSAQFYEAALNEHPEIPDDIARGEFGALHDWLKEQLYRHGRKYTTAELIKRMTGKPLTIAPYIRYLRSKYGELYSLCGERDHV